MIDGFPLSFFLPLNVHVLWTAFFVDNAHRIPGLNQLPSLTFWVLPSLIGLPFLVVSLSRFATKRMVPVKRPGLERKEETI